jgi:hypothetical protein
MEVSIRIALLAGCLSFLAACASVPVDERLGRSWQGCSVNALERLWGAADEVVREGDGRRLRYARVDGSCTYYFNTDWSGTIVGYRYNAASGGACRPVDRYRLPLRQAAGEGCG